jgi:hypothetical protein
VKAEQRQQSRLVAEVVATRQLHERLAAERERAEDLRKSLVPDWAELSDERKSSVVTAFELSAGSKIVEGVQDAYRAVTVPAAWGRMQAMRIAQVSRAVPTWCKWFILIAALLPSASQL